MNQYDAFIRTKRRQHSASGFQPESLHDSLLPHHRTNVERACRMGRAAVFADTGLGKTRMQLDWARQVKRHTGGEVLLLAPLAVGDQTLAEAAEMGIDPPVVLNYERLHQVDPSDYVGVVLDESSILKAVDGKTRSRLTEAFQATDYRLACTATPAPNDHTEPVITRNSSAYARAKRCSRNTSCMMEGRRSRGGRRARSARVLAMGIDVGRYAAKAKRPRLRRRPIRPSAAEPA